MGSACTKSQENQVLQPQTQQELSINYQLSQYLRIDHPYNVNLKYQSFCIYKKDEYVGYGIKKTNTYKTTLTKDELQKKRNEFWDTRVEGQKYCWEVLRKAATELDEKDALAMMAAIGLKLVNKSMQIAFDEHQKYDVPIFCINDPLAFETVPAHERNILKNFKEEDIELKVRCTKLHDKDLGFTVKNKITVEQLKKIFVEQAKDSEINKVRFFVDGREMFDHHQLGNYENIKSNKIITAFALKDMTIENEKTEQ